MTYLSLMVWFLNIFQNTTRHLSYIVGAEQIFPEIKRWLKSRRKTNTQIRALAELND